MADATERNEDLNGDDSLESAASSADAPEAESVPDADSIPQADSTPEVVGEEQVVETEEERIARETEEELLWIFQSTVFDNAGQKIGRVGQVYLDDQTQNPNWVTVKTGLFGMKEYFIPLDGSERADKRITVPFAKATVLAAPRTEVDQNLSPSEEDALYNHYQVEGKMTEAASEDEITNLVEGDGTDTTSADTADGGMAAVGTDFSAETDTETGTDTAASTQENTEQSASAAPWEISGDDETATTETVAPWHRGDEEPSEAKSEFDALISDEQPANTSTHVPNEVFARPEDTDTATEETTDPDQRQ
ncbi:PRC-barrel domain-containing protein [Gulosibacter molinativorax]|uniref:PRC-barrel domain containing protein n=1 Tax=Gulosibacter molinativorax TaxID=256821 RepID=A0ABT7CA92_9MICO|nr:PRC-barrel domain-containing protein [Gulosibacter molinativorax]MDJ1372110.1 PRC-barrel domain containing protein [Gulosibacter molinativorax]QUY62345.1 Photosystem reaction center subunit H [Gulosibacter molinativorax]